VCDTFQTVSRICLAPSHTHTHSLSRPYLGYPQVSPKIIHQCIRSPRGCSSVVFWRSMSSIASCYGRTTIDWHVGSLRWSALFVARVSYDVSRCLWRVIPIMSHCRIIIRQYVPCTVSSLIAQLTLLKSNGFQLSNDHDSTF
jgi:hypothetical protein